MNENQPLSQKVTRLVPATATPMEWLLAQCKTQRMSASQLICGDFVVTEHEGRQAIAVFNAVQGRKKRRRAWLQLPDGEIQKVSPWDQVTVVCSGVENALLIQAAMYRWEKQND